METQPSPLGLTLAVTVTQFRPIGGIFPISATYKVVSASPGVSVFGATIVIKGSQPAKLVFQLTDKNHVFVGATFDATGATPDVGTTEFPSIVIDRTATGNTLTIIDANDPQNIGKAYSYVLLVQSALTAEIGLIDPNIINDGGP
jgi:hypothetical protein